jgi:hypothetical protein
VARDPSEQFRKAAINAPYFESFHERHRPPRIRHLICEHFGLWTLTADELIFPQILIASGVIFASVPPQTLLLFESWGFSAVPLLLMWCSIAMGILLCKTPASGPWP